MTGILSWWESVGDRVLTGFTHIGAMARFFRRWLYWATVGPFRERTIYRPEVFHRMEEVGNRSLPIIALVLFLIGIILVYQTSDVMKKYGQTQKIPLMVSLSITRELGPLMTAIMVIARVGSSYTAGIGMMRHNEEIRALETMAINPIGYLVAPRAIAMVVMLPVLTVLAAVIGIAGGSFIGYTIHQMPPSEFFVRAFDELKLMDILGGVIKSFVFAHVIVTVACYCGFTAAGGPEGVMKNTQRSVVYSILLVIFVDSIMSAAIAPLAT